MSEPLVPSFQVPVSDVVFTATKSVIATLTTGLGVLTLLGTSISDGNLTWAEGGTLIGAVATAVATIAAVWRVPNQVKGVRDLQ
jgi:hypothetical protein